MFERRRRLADVALPIRPRFCAAAQLHEQIAEVVERLVVVRIEGDRAPPVFDCGHIVAPLCGDHTETVLVGVLR